MRIIEYQDNTSSRQRHCSYSWSCINTASEQVEFEEDTLGIAPNLESNNVVIVLMDDSLIIQEESFVKAIRRIAQISVSKVYLGRLQNAPTKHSDGRDEVSACESQLTESMTRVLFQTFCI